MAEVKNKLREFRVRKGLTQEELAETLKVSRQTINSIENGRYSPSLELALKIAKFFRVRVEDIFWLEE